MSSSDTMIARVVHASRRQSRGYLAIYVGLAVIALLTIAKAWPPPALVDTTQDIQ